MNADISRTPDLSVWEEKRDKGTLPRTAQILGILTCPHCSEQAVHRDHDNGDTFN